MIGARELAFECLVGSGGEALRRLGALRARGELATSIHDGAVDLLKTEARRRATLRVLLRRFAPREVKPPLATRLVLSLAELYFLEGVDERRAISRASALTRRSLGAGPTRLLRTTLFAALAARQQGRCGDPRRDLPRTNWHLDAPLFTDPVEHPLLWAEEALSVPVALFKRWDKRLGSERARDLAERALVEGPYVLRAVGASREALVAELAAGSITGRPADHPNLWLVPRHERAALRRCRAFAEGRALLQSPIALRSAEIAEVGPGARVLDLGAGLGERACVLAEAGARVWAFESDPGLRTALARRLDRLGLAGRVTICDGAPDEAFDLVLAAPPCRRTGMLAARPQARWRLDPGRREQIARAQTELFGLAADRVRRGGRLVWVNASFEPEDGERAVREFLARRPDFELEAEHTLGLDPEPCEYASDGGYIARLARR